ncbi:MAG: GtrA family protein [Chloroflexi bacterium]|nr:GtrA family protein [Chloroflexota bacterium]
MKSVKSTRLYGAARENKQEVKRFVKFAVVGFSGLIVDYTVLNILAHIFDVASWLAIAIAFVVAASNNFVWNRLWVYPESRQHSLWKHFPTFLIVNAVGLGINELILFLFELPIEQLVGSSIIGLNLTKAIAAVIVMAWNFLVNRFVTFRDVKWQRNARKPAVEQKEQFESAL